MQVGIQVSHKCGPVKETRASLTLVVKGLAKAQKAVRLVVVGVQFLLFLVQFAGARFDADGFPLDNGLDLILTPGQACRFLGDDPWPQRRQPGRPGELR